MWLFLSAICFAVPCAVWCKGAHVLGLDTGLKKVVFTSNVVIFLAWAVLTHWTKHREYSLIPFIMIVTLFKLLGSLALYRVQDGCFPQFKADMCKYKSQLAMFVGPAVLYALSDLLRVDTIQRTDPLTYEVLANMRMILVA